MMDHVFVLLRAIRRGQSGPPVDTVLQQDGVQVEIGQLRSCQQDQIAA